MLAEEAREQTWAHVLHALHFLAAFAPRGPRGMPSVCFGPPREAHRRGQSRHHTTADSRLVWVSSFCALSLLEFLAVQLAHLVAPHFALRICTYQFHELRFINGSDSNRRWNIRQFDFGSISQRSSDRPLDFSFASLYTVPWLRWELEKHTFFSPRFFVQT
jgi:hypothetical protein